MNRFIRLCGNKFKNSDHHSAQKYLNLPHRTVLVDLSQVISFQIVILLVIYSKIYSSNVTIKYSILETMGLKKGQVKKEGELKKSTHCVTA